MTARRKHLRPSGVQRLYMGEVGEKIEEKADRIRREFGEDVVLYLSQDNVTDFGNWAEVDRIRLPAILHKSGALKGLGKVHILHEFIHLEMFFIDGYKIIGCKPGSNSQTMNMERKFKNVPENYVAHKVIRSYRPGFDSIFNPIISVA